MHRFAFGTGSWCVATMALVGVVASGCRRESRAEASPNAVGGGPNATSSAGEKNDAPSAPLLPGATCAFPTRIDHDVTIAAGCVADVVQNVLVANGSTLTLEPGVTLRFGEASYLEIGHRGSRLVACGTAERPIVFTSGASTARPGDWVGLAFDEASGDSAIEHAVIEFAGRDSHGGRGALTVFGPAAAHITLRDVVLHRNNLAAIDVEREGWTFAAFDRVHFGNDALAMRVPAGVLASLGEAIDFGDDGVEVTGGAIDRPGVFPRVHAPIVVTRSVSVGSISNEKASLVIADGDVLRFAKGTWLDVGVDGSGALLAQNVVFDSAAQGPAKGDWVGIVFGGGSNGSRLSGCAIDHAGAPDHGGDGAITFLRPWQGLDVSLYGNAFRDNAQSQLSDGGDGCDRLLDPKNGNSFSGTVEPCR